MQKTYIINVLPVAYNTHDINADLEFSSYYRKLLITSYLNRALSKLGHCAEKENAETLIHQQTGFEPRLSRVRCSTAELLSSGVSHLKCIER